MDETTNDGATTTRRPSGEIETSADEPPAEVGAKPEPASPGRSWIDALLRFGEIAGMCSLAIAAPLLSKYGSADAAFLVRGFTQSDYVWLGLGIVLVPPLVLWVLTELPGLVNARAAEMAHQVVIGLLAGLLVVLVLGQTPLVLKLVAGIAAAALAYAIQRRYRFVRTWLRWLAFGPILLLIPYLFSSETAALLAEAGGPGTVISDVPIEEPRPVVLIIFDELPTASLLDGAGEIDEQSFPNFARLADASTFYPNYSSVSPSTGSAVGSILTGRYPQPAKQSIYSEFPVSVFTVLGEQYPVRGGETVTRLCPTDVCRTKGVAKGSMFTMAAGDLADLFTGSESAGEDPAADDSPDPDDFLDIASEAEFHDPHLLADFRDELASYRGGNALYMSHVILPHYPFEFSANGQRYKDPDGGSVNIGMVNFTWTSEYAAQSGRQRHLQQLAYTDRWLGELLDAMQDSGLWDEAVIAVVADHGAAFIAGEKFRPATTENVHESLWAPFFLRAPGLATGVVDERDVMSIDVLPTILDLLGIPPGLPIDGISAVQDPAADQPERYVISGKLNDVGDEENGYGSVDSAVTYERLLASEPHGEGDDDLRWWRIGEFADVIAKRVDELPAGRARVDGGMLLNGHEREYDPQAPSAELFARGVTDWRGDVAIALNGTIVAVAPTNRAGVFFTLLPDSRFVEGANSLDLYALERDGETATITPIPRTDG